MKVSAIIPTWNLSSKLDKCLEHLYKYTDMDKVQIIIVDNGSNDETFHMVMDKYFRHGTDSYLKLARNHGFGEASNMGARASDGELLLFLNNDVYVSEEGWLDNMASEILAGATIVGHKLLYANDTIQHAGIFFNVQGIPLHLWRGKPADYEPTLHTKRLTAVTGACMMICSDDFSRLGGFDTSYINGFEDIDLCFKSVSMSGRISCCMDSKIYHDECSTPSRRDFDARNAQIFVSRWFAPQVRGGSE